MDYILDSFAAGGLDKKTIDLNQIQGSALMEQASLRISDHLLRKFNIHQSKLVFVCGKGNNGGDCAGAARNLINYGINNLVTVLVLNKNNLPKVVSTGQELDEFVKKHVSTDLYLMLQSIIAAGRNVHIISSEEKLDCFKELLKETDYIIDGIFGNGLAREIDGTYKSVIEAINSYVSSSTHTSVLSIDIPSGISADTGKVLGCAIKADETITFNYKKFGHIIYPGREYSGNLIVEWISFDKNHLHSEELQNHVALTIDYTRPNAYWQDDKDLLNKSYAMYETSNQRYTEHITCESENERHIENNTCEEQDQRYMACQALNNEYRMLAAENIIVKRASDSNKGTYGKLLCISGCDDMPGAAVLSSEAALRSGCGLVAVLSSQKCLETVSRRLPEAVLVNQNKYWYNSDYVIKEADSTATANQNIFKNYNAVIIGPGLSKSDIARQKVLSLFDSSFPGSKCRTVIDADAINIISDIMNEKGLAHTDERLAFINNSLPDEIIFTPHKKELSRLLNIPMSELCDLVNIAKQLINKTQKVFLLKDANTLVAGRGKLYINQSGNNGMSTAGSGDVLSGIIGSFLAQGYDTFNAAMVGAFVHGMAGDLAATEKGVRGLIAGDIVNNLPKALYFM